MNQRGVTFLELIICIGILGFIGSLSMLLLGSTLRHQQLDSASFQLVADLRWLQQLTMNGDATMSYVLLLNLKAPYGYLVTANRQVLKKNVFPSSVQLLAEYPSISFSPSGAPQTGMQTISLQSDKQDLRNYVILAPVTGRVRISHDSPHGED